MLKSELNKCLQKFYLCARKQDGMYYNKKSLMAIRAAIDCYLLKVPADTNTANLSISINDGNQILRGLIPGGMFIKLSIQF